MKELRNNAELLTTLLTVLFIGLKLTNYIDWSWWWVLSPLWTSLGIGLIVLLIIGIILFLKYLKLKNKKFDSGSVPDKKHSPVFESRFQKRMREMQDRRNNS